MKKILNVLLILLLCISVAACNSNNAPEEETSGNASMANPMVSYDSLDDINKITGVQIVSPAIMGKTNEKFFVIADKIAQYDFELNGSKFTVRGALEIKEDISGIHDESNVFNSGDDFTCYTNDFYLERFFDVDKQYTIVLTDPGDVTDEQFSNICSEFESIMKWHRDDPAVGDYQDSISERATATVERFGDTYNIVVDWSTSANELTCWYMYDAVLNDGKLEYKEEQMYHNVYDENGETISSDEKVNTTPGYFTIEDNKLYWTKASEEYLQECVFEKIVY